ncbi:NAD(P)H-binding protein [Frankia sp. Mgl5]|uniref:NAD(P)H-binding protein n=1 Tax=Frankia sp. Mgl5 TaxID=2933793 RepID=UPI00200F819F|nr:NAD(P)H-binding protein [Frankia sp. Mgl5]MCK9929678.1 NAD(P)H-binding protein [Frankia sp. Mgl5]
MIIVTGASGHLGRQTIRELVGRVEASRIMAVSRTPGTLIDLGVAARFGDFDDQDSLVETFGEAERVLIVSVTGADRFPRHRRAIDAAAEAGVGHIVFTSFSRADEPDNPSPHIDEYRATERHLVAAGVPFTALRFNLWPETMNEVGVAARAVASGRLPSNAEDRRVGYITRDDSAAVCAAVLAQGTDCEDQGQFLEVTGPAGVTDAEVAAALAEATGRPVRHQPVADDEIIAALVAIGLAEPFARGWGAMGIAKRAGWFDTTTRQFEALTGRTATSVAEFFTRQRTTLLGG